MGMMMGAGIIPGPFARADERGLDEIAQGARERAGRAGASGLRAARSCCAAWSPRAGSARRRPGLLPVPAARRGRHEGDRRARDARRRAHRDPVAQPPADEPAVADGDQGADGGVEAGRRQGARDDHRVVEHLHVRRRRGHQGVHEDGRGDRRARWSSPRTSCMREHGDLAHGHDRGGQLASPSAAAASSRWRATSASPPSRPRSASPRSTSGSSPASAAPSGCRGSWARRKALEMNLVGDPIDAYEAQRHRARERRSCPTTSCSTRRSSWARKLADQAPIAIEQIKKVSAQGRPRRGARRPRRRASRRRSSPRTRRKESAHSSASGQPKFKGE